MKCVVIGKTSFTSKKTGRQVNILAIGTRNEYWQGYKVDTKFCNDAVYASAVIGDSEVAFDMQGNIESVQPLK